MGEKSYFFIIDLFIYNVLHKAHKEHCGRVRSDGQIIGPAPEFVY